MPRSNSNLSPLVGRVNPDDPDVLEAEGHEEIASGNVKIARALRLRAVRRDAPTDEIIQVARFLEFGFQTERSFADAMRDGRIISFRAGNKRCAYRRDIVAYLATRRAAPKPVELDTEGTDDDDYRRTAGAAE